MRNNLKLIILLIFVILAINGCDKNEQIVQVESVTLDKTSLTMIVGDAVTLTVTALPINAENKNIEWYSTNSSVLSVDETGKIEALKTGKADIFVVAGNGVMAICTITVELSPLPIVPEGVLINGVRWASSNVDKPDTFAKKTEDFGMYYQWGRRKGWAITDNETEWDSSVSTSTVWEKGNDPCPAGWRIPTRDELRSLNESGSTWETINGVTGRLFGTAPNEIFLPAAGRVHLSQQIFIPPIDFIGTNGMYWSSANNRPSELTSGLGFLASSIEMTFFHQVNGLSIRCVAE
ncbi:MAG: Ig-like domain-containing protein [Dysgonamonadaceae bacterium]|jgi:uncharacterized protein (TIGR02145 family)|nr:Ig-like domain-containing protein [Dysgonamonadaceae bacterium]